MDISDKIKELIADGKTLDAIDALQAFLKDKDENLLNQTYLLESQFKDIQKKMRLNLQETSVELNRINFTILDLADDIRGIKGNKVVEKEAEPDEKEEKTDTSNLKYALIIFAILLLVAALFIIPFVLMGDKK